MKAKDKAIQWRESEEALLEVLCRWTEYMDILEKAGLRQKGLGDSESAVSEAYRILEEYEAEAKLWDLKQDSKNIMRVVHALNEQLDRIELPQELKNAHS